MSQERTNIEKFNYYLREFIAQLKHSFPDLNSIFEANYSDLIQANPNLKNDTYLKHYVKHANPVASKIAVRDTSLFDNSIELLPHLDFGMIWKMKNMTESSQQASWKYLEVLFVIGRSCMSDNQEIQSMIQNFRQGKMLWSGDQTVAMNKMIEEIRQKKIENPTAFDDKDSDDEDDGGAKMPGLLGKLADFDLSKMTDMIQNNPLMKEIMSDLQEEFQDMDSDEGDGNNEAKMEDMFKKMESGDMASKIQNVMSKVTKKVRENIENGNLNPQEMQNNIMNSMGGMGINMEEMARNMGVNLNGAQRQGLNQMNQQSKLDARRERLRRKLEEKKKQEKQ